MSYPLSVHGIVCLHGCNYCWGEQFMHRVPGQAGRQHIRERIVTKLAHEGLFLGRSRNMGWFLCEAQSHLEVYLLCLYIWIDLACIKII